MMSVLEIYLNWVNSTLAEVGGHVDGVESLQDGKVLCELIDILDPDAGLLSKVKASGDCTPQTYISAAIEHMRRHEVKIKFTAEDIIQSDVKSMLDVLWILILNYDIHFIGQSTQNRTIGIGKKNLLEWCQRELDTELDPSETLSFNLCSGNSFLKLLEKIAGHNVQKSEDKSEYMDALLSEIQDRYHIKRNIIKASDIVDGTVDEHTLMIYLSLLKRKIYYFQQKAHPLSSDSQISQSTVLFQEGEQKDRGKSGSLNSDLNKDLSVQTFEDNTSDWPSMRLQLSEFEKLSPEHDFSSKYFSHGNHSHSQIVSNKVVDQLPRVSTDSDGGKEIESQMIGEKEKDTLLEFSSISPNRDKHVSDIPSTLQEMKNSTLSIGNPAVSKFSDKSSVPSSTFKHNPTTNASHTVSDTSQEQTYMMSNQSQTEQHVRRLPDHRYREDAREESVRIRIKRPKDYICQWEDAIDRLSAISVTDEFGSPISPLISSYKTSLPSRSKSQEAGRSLNRNPMNTNFKKSNTLLARSKSNDILPTSAASSQDVQIHSSRSYPTEMHISRTLTTSDEIGKSSVEESSNTFGGLPGNMQLQMLKISSVPGHASRPEDPTHKDDINMVQENITISGPQGSFTSHRNQSHVSGETNGQTILKKRVRSEPPSSGSRVRFQQPTNVTSYDKHAQSEVPFHSSTSNLSQRVHSLSSSRQNISSHGPAGDREMEPDAILSKSQTSRSPQLFLPSGRQNEAEIKKYPLDESSGDVYSAASHLHRKEMVPNNLDISERILEDESALNLTHDRDRIDYPEETYLYRSRNMSSERASSNTAVIDVSNLGYRWDLEIKYEDDPNEGREDSPPPIRRGGTGRVPRREAWEQEKQRKENEPLLDSQADMEAQCRTIEVLGKEIEVLKQKVEMLEEGETHRLSWWSRSHSTGNKIKHGVPYPTRNVEDYNRQLTSAEQMKTQIQTDRERATSCPLLQPSRRSKATRSVFKNTATSGTSQSKTYLNHPITTFLDSNSKSSFMVNDEYSASSSDIVHSSEKVETDIGYMNSSHVMNPEVRIKNLTIVGSLDLQKIEKLISRRELSEPEVTELKQAVACALVENDILQTKLGNARHEIHDKLKHTNGVLDDCRHHLAKAQAENMELRTMLKQEQQKSEAYSSKVIEFEKNILEVKTDNQYLGSELDQSLAKIDALEEENTRLTSRLSYVEHDNDALREKVNILQHNQIKAMNTMDELRECLSRIRQERQDLCDELTSVQRQEETKRARQIIINYQEKGVEDKHEKGQDLMEESERTILDDPGCSSHYSPSSSYCSHSSQPSRNLDDTDRFPQRLSRHPSSDNLPITPWQHSGTYEELYTLDREIYPHRQGYIPRSRSCSPHKEGRYTSPDHYNSLSRDKSGLNQTLPERKQDLKREQQKLVKNGVQYSHPRLHLSRSPDSHKATRHGSFSPSRRVVRSSERICKPHSVQYRLHKSFISTEDLSSSPLICTPELSILKGSFKSGEKQSTIFRSKSPSFINHSEQDFSLRRNHSPPTRLSPKDKTRKSVIKIKRRPLHTKSEAGEIAKKFQKEFDREDKMITSLSKSQKKRWFEVQSESEDEDTGINSSMSSHSSCEHLYARRKAPILSEAQKRYADELIKKYTGRSPCKQTL